MYEKVSYPKYTKIMENVWNVLEGTKISQLHKMYQNAQKTIQKYVNYKSKCAKLPKCKKQIKMFQNSRNEKKKCKKWPKMHKNLHLKMGKNFEKMHENNLKLIKYTKCMKSFKNIVFFLSQVYDIEQIILWTFESRLSFPRGCSQRLILNLNNE